MSRLRRALIAGIAGVAALLTGISQTTTASAAAPAVTWEAATGEQRLIEDSLFGTLTVVPGFERTRSVVVRNAGDRPGDLTVSVVDARVHDEPRDGFFDELTVNGVPASRLAAQRVTAVHGGPLAPGESVEVPLTLAFHGSSGNAAVVGQQTFSFDLRMTLSGDTRGQEVARVASGEPGAPALGRPGATGPTAQTGGFAEEAAPWLLLGAAALALALALARRRQEEGTV